ncbi:hypothetical protein AM228_06025 [Planktothricoides sp. SR001]|nr:hypothetical protein AM228_06025 [Planktothricoides sp. SR001]
MKRFWLKHEQVSLQPNWYGGFFCSLFLKSKQMVIGGLILAHGRSPITGKDLGTGLIPLTTGVNHPGRR